MADEKISYSHPDQPVRHSYPVKITDDGFFSALNLTLRTGPYILLRLGLMIGFTLVAVIWLGLCGGLAYLFSGKDGGGGGGVVLFLFGIILPAGVFFWFKQYVLYLLKCGHVAVLTKLMTDGELPPGTNQIEYGKNIVLGRFMQMNVLVAVDSFVLGIARSFNRTLDWITGLIPIPGMESIMQFVHTIVNRATTFIDETILSYNLARGDANVWRSSLDGLLYYAANAKPILKTAVISTLIQYALTFGCFLICLVPAFFIQHFLPAAVSGYAWIAAVAMAAAIKSAFLEPIFLVMVALTFHKNVQNQPINEAWAETLASASGKFQELKQKAQTFVSNPVPQPATAAPQ